MYSPDPRLRLPSVTGTGPRVLLVDDSLSAVHRWSAALRDELPRARVEAVATLEAATTRLATPVEVVITGLRVPDAPGFHAVTVLRRLAPDAALLATTGSADRGVVLAALGEGADDHLTGDETPAQLADTVLWALRRRHAAGPTDPRPRVALAVLDALDAPTCAVDPRGQVVAVNRAWRDFSAANGGGAATTGVGASYLDVCRDAPPGSDGQVVAEGLAAVLTGELARFERAYPCPSPVLDRWFSARITALPDGAGAVVSHVDITALKRAELALEHRSRHDELTDLPNRVHLEDRLRDALVGSASRGLRVAVAFVDLDLFKHVNDTHGHPLGDELLRAVATRLAHRAREGDTVSRFAGDEFVLVRPDVRSDEEALRMAERLVGSFEEPFVLSTATVTVSVSVGVAVGTWPQPADELLVAADAAMYEAKSRGRGRSRMFDEALRVGTLARRRTAVELSRALVRAELVLHYQPVVHLRTGAVTGVEALVRWAHPDGLRMPADFIPVAEATGLVLPLGRWVVGEACRQAAEWAAHGLDLQVAVNLSARQVSHPDVVATITDALDRTGLPADRLLVEVTESALMEDVEAGRALEQIDALGTPIAIDDFGTGYSSLVYLKHYPIRALKVDRSFVAGMGIDPDDDAIVASVVGLAAAVGADCIGEGVETVAQLEQLRALGCGYAQGFLFSPAVPAADVPAAVARCQAGLVAATLPRPRLVVEHLG